MQKRSFFLPLLASVFLYFLIACSRVLHYQKTPDVLAWEKDIVQLNTSTQLKRILKLPFSLQQFKHLSLNTIQEDMSPWKVISERIWRGKTKRFCLCMPHGFIYPHNPSAIVIFIANVLPALPPTRHPMKLRPWSNQSTLYYQGTKCPRTDFYWIEISPTRRAGLPATDPKSQSKNTIYFVSTMKIPGYSNSGAFLTPELQPRPELFFLTTQLHSTMKAICSGHPPSSKITCRKFFRAEKFC
jgi:hypothetical protein